MGETHSQYTFPLESSMSTQTRSDLEIFVDCNSVDASTRIAWVIRDVMTQPTMRSGGGCLGESFDLDPLAERLGGVAGTIIRYALADLISASGKGGAESALLIVDSNIVTWEGVTNPLVG